MLDSADSDTMAKADATGETPKIHQFDFLQNFQRQSKRFQSRTRPRPPATSVPYSRNTSRPYPELTDSARAPALASHWQSPLGLRLTLQLGVIPISNFRRALDL